MRWPIQRAQTWHDRNGWICGFNYVTSTAVNSTEMWQAETFDPDRIARELGWARAWGFSACRIFLQFLAWKADAPAFADRLEHVLELAGSHGMRVMPVLFDDCAFSGKQPYLGPQAPPVPGVHNSGWTPSPGHQRSADPQAWPELETYVADLITRFGRDERIHAWDLYNEPGNSGRGDRSLPLLEACFQWARDATPSQPLTAGTWNRELTNLNRVSIAISDVISFHAYEDLAGVENAVQELSALAGGRPLVCTEWMARTLGSTFPTHLPFFRRRNISCFSWGLVQGKTQTHLPWDSPEGAHEPELWFHDLLYPDGSPYAESDRRAILTQTGSAAE